MINTCNYYFCHFTNLSSSQSFSCFVSSQSCRFFLFEHFVKNLSSLVAHYNSPSFLLPIPLPGSERIPLPFSQRNIDIIILEGLTTVLITFYLPPSTTISLPFTLSSTVSPMNISPEIPITSFPILIPPFTKVSPPQILVEPSSSSFNIP